MDVLKKAAESRRNARLNPDGDEEVEAEGDVEHQGMKGALLVSNGLFMRRNPFKW